MSRGLKWKPRLSAQHTGFLRQSSCLSWGEKALQNLQTNLQVICFSFSVLTESAHMPSQGCPRQLELCSKRPFICVFVPQPCHSSPPLRRACLLRGVVTAGDTLTFLSVCSQGRQLRPPVFPVIRGYFQWGAMVKLDVTAQTGQIKGLSCFLVSKQRPSSAEFTGQTLLLFCVVNFSLSNL